jgi:hypothetical protein
LRTVAAGGIAAVLTLTGMCEEPATSPAVVLRWKTSRISRGLEGASNLPSRPATTVIAASHEVPESQEGQTTSGLRPAFKAPAKADRWNKSKAGSPSNLLSSDGAIRLVAHDPHSDPFGDRVSQAGREPALAPPDGTRKAGLNDHAEGAVQPEASDPTPKAPGSLKPIEDLPLPMEEDRNPPPSVGPLTDAYNYRDCAKAEEGCRMFAETLRGVPLSEISLNIMPRYKPDATSQEADDKERTEQLKESNSRDWKDRGGRLLATGRLGDFKHGKVIVTDDSGAKVAAINVQELGADELCFLTGWWRLPGECPISDDRPVTRNFQPSTFTWTASALCHKPLYFEEVQLERYGHTAGPIKQPILSGAHFFLNIAALPYKMAINPPMECQYPLGYYRPGDCAPWHIPPIPISLRGAAAEAGAWVGGIFIIP